MKTSWPTSGPATSPATEPVAVTRDRLLADPRSGVRPLGAAPAAPAPAPAAAAPAAPTAPLPAAADGDGEPQDDEPQDDEPREPRDYRVEGAGALLALFAYPLAVNLLLGGPAQMWGWVKAKWVNEPYGGQASGAAGPAPSASSAAGPTRTGLPPAQSALLPFQLGLTNQP